MLVKLLVNLLVKLTKLELGGAMGLWVRGMHLGEARTISNSSRDYYEAIATSPSNPWSVMGSKTIANYEAIARNIARIARSIARNSTRIY